MMEQFHWILCGCEKEVEFGCYVMGMYCGTGSAVLDAVCNGEEGELGFVREVMARACIWVFQFDTQIIFYYIYNQKTIKLR